MKKRFHTPTIFQMEMVECGAAALSMILGFYKRFVSLDQLRIDCGVSRDGTKALNIVLAAKKYGLDAHGYKISVDELDQVQLPCIAFWRFNHFVVVEGYSNTVVYINDPATGHREVPLVDFANEFSGVVLEFTPTSDFMPAGKPIHVSEQLLKRLKGNKKTLTFLFINGLLFTLLGLLTPLFGKMFVDLYLIEQTTSIIKLLIIGLSTTILLRFGLSYLQNFYFARFENKLAISFSRKFLWHVLQLPLRFFSQRYAGDITYRMELNRSVARFIASVFIQTGLEAILVVVYFALLFYFNSLMGILISIIAGINMLVFYHITKLRRDKSLLLSVDLSNYYCQCFSAFRLIESIKASGAEQEVFIKVVGSQANVSNAIHTLNQQSILFNTIPLALNVLSSIMILALGSFFIMQGNMSIGTLVAIQTIVISLMNPLNRLVLIAGNIQEISGSIAKLDDVLSYPIEDQENLLQLSHSEHLIQEETHRLSGQIEIKNLSFGFNILEAPLLQNINLTISPGEHVAIIGSSGSGKSTLAKLIAGLYHPWEGQVLIDDNPIEHINRMILANSLIMVEQENILFHGKITDNLTMWDNTVSFKKIIQGTKEARIHEQISLRPHGYNTVIQENGSNMSGGERQRMDIARALIANPNIIILDEATSELDPIIESVIYDNIRKRGCTTIIIAHRLNTIRNADKIIVLDQGCIVQVGTHNSLIEIPGWYKNLMSAT